MFIAQLSQFLILVWKLSSVFVIPLIMIGYVALINSYDEGFTFEDLDQGKNFHKWLVFAIYLTFILVWKRSNKRVISYFKKLEY